MQWFSLLKFFTFIFTPVGFIVIIDDSTTV